MSWRRSELSWFQHIKMQWWASVDFLLYRSEIVWYWRRVIFLLPCFTGKIVFLLLCFASPKALNFPELWEAEQSVQQGKLHK